MKLLAYLQAFASSVFHRSHVDNEMDEELRSHIQIRADDLERSGLPRTEAERRARIEFGGVERFKEEVRDTLWETHVDNLFRDFRYALRSLRKDRRFAFVAICALALGIGSCTIMFSVIYNVLFDAFPYKDPQRTVTLKMVNLANAGGWKGRNFFSAQEVRAFQDQNHVFEEMIGAEVVRVFYDDGKSTRQVENGAVVTTNTFEYLGVPPLLGRTITPDDGKPGATPVFVMHYRLWQTEFGGDPKIVGTTFILNDEPRTLVGIMPPRFNWYGAVVWMPNAPGDFGLDPMGRLKPGVSVKAAAADLDVIAHGVQKANPSETTPAKFAIRAETLLDTVVGDFKDKLYALLGAVLLLLLIACSNVANLLLARATAREKEMAVRASLGASRGRLIRQLLVEGFVLAWSACVLGCVLAYFGLKTVVALIPPDAIAGETVIRFSAPVLLMSLGVTVLTTLLCGLAPALHVVRDDLQPRLTGTGKGTGASFRHGRLRAGLVTVEVALSIVLLIGAGLLMRSFLVLTRADLGFNPKNVLYFRLSLPKTYDAARDKQNALTRELLERMKILPGVTSVSESMLLPPLTYDWSDTIISGKPHSERWETRYEICSAGFFQTLGLRLLSGRLFSEQDVDAARFVMVVNQNFASHYFPHGEPIGQKVKLQILDRKFLDAPHDTYFEIVGVVSDYKTRSAEPPSWQAVPQAFIPYSVQGFSWRTYMVRTAVDPKSLIRAIGEEVRAIDPGVGIEVTGTIESSLAEYYRGPQFELATLGTFASIGLVLVVIGIFSVMAYSVSLRTQEIGIRLALGAQRTNILRMVLLNGFQLVAAGVLIGLASSYALTRLLGSQISGVSATDPWTFGAVIILIVATGLTACLLPARRAARVDPLVALRYE
jgi:predicted permease